MLSRTSLFLACAVNLFACAQNANSQEILTPTQGATVTNGKANVIFKPIIVTQEFGGKRVTSPSAVIVVFPYETRSADPSKADKLGQLVAVIYGADGRDLGLPIESYANATVGAYIMTFGSRSQLGVGSIKPIADAGAAPFPSLQFALESPKAR